MQNNIIDFANDYGDVISTHCNWQCVLKALSFSLAGIVISILPFMVKLGSDTAMMMCLVLGPLLVIMGMCLAFFNSTELRYMPTNSPVRVHSSYMSPTSIEAVEKSLRNANIALGTGAHLEGTGQLRIDTLTSDDKKLCLCMIFQYVPYCYKPLYGPFVINADLAHRFSQCRL